MGTDPSATVVVGTSVEATRVFMVGYAKQDQRGRQYAHIDRWVG